MMTAAGASRHYESPSTHFNAAFQRIETSLLAIVVVISALSFVLTQEAVRQPDMESLKL